MESKAAVQALSALAQEARLTVFRLLVAEGPPGLPAGEIASRCAVPPNTLSFHLKELTNAGLLTSRREGRSIIYSVHTSGISDLLAFLTEDCCQGRPDLCLPTNSMNTCCTP